MKNVQTKKGFTLIELLIVIAIIAVLAVAFLPTLLGAPAKGRDTSRIADLQKIQKVLVNSNLEGKAYPSVAGEIKNDLLVKDSGAKWDVTFATSFGGKLPVDPQAPDKKYMYYVKPGSYAFGLSANVEVKTNANAKCADVKDGKLTPLADADAEAEWCYAVFTQ